MQSWVPFLVSEEKFIVEGETLGVIGRVPVHVFGRAPVRKIQGFHAYLCGSFWKLLSVGTSLERPLSESVIQAKEIIGLCDYPG
jgi:hypothetical protein